MKNLCADRFTRTALCFETACEQYWYSLSTELYYMVRCLFSSLWYLSFDKHLRVPKLKDTVHKYKHEKKPDYKILYILKKSFLLLKLHNDTLVMPFVCVRLYFPGQLQGLRKALLCEDYP